MPQRVSSRILAYGGVALVLVSGVLIVSPVLSARSDLANRLVMENGELDEITRIVNAIRDAVSALRQARTTGHEYERTGSQEDQAAYHKFLLAARASLEKLRAADAGFWPRVSPLADQLLADLAHGVALQDAGQHDEAVITSMSRAGQDLMIGIEGITRERLKVLRQRYREILSTIQAARDDSDEFARIMFGLAGASFALGCIALVTYLRRHFVAEADLRAGRDAAMEAANIKMRFIATASHDLRQPLHAISMFVGVLRRRSRDPMILEVVEKIAPAIASMQRMFALLLDVARLDARAIKAEYRGFALQELFDALAVEFAASAASKGLQLEILPTPFSVSTDPALLETILRNLLSNALKFTDHGLVGMTTRRVGAMVDIIVFDTGVGIAAKDQTVIFEEFERLGQRDGSREGLGLGLAIVKRMADLLGVVVTLESEVASGSRFTVSIPWVETVQTASQEEARLELELHDHRILVLDDHPDSRKAIALAIEALGAVPLEAASPAAALSLLGDMAPEAPQAAVVDHDLGGGQTGPDFLDAYFARSGKILPAVILTGSTDALTLATLAATGRPWLIKPVDLDALRSTLAELIDRAAVTVSTHA